MKKWIVGPISDVRNWFSKEYSLMRICDSVCSMYIYLLFFYPDPSSTDLVTLTTCRGKLKPSLKGPQLLSLGSYKFIVIARNKFRAPVALCRLDLCWFWQTLFVVSDFTMWHFAVCIFSLIFSEVNRSSNGKVYHHRAKGLGFDSNWWSAVETWT